MIVGLTGGIGSGKTTVADFLGELGAYIIDWDELARKVVEPYQEAWKGIVEHFGEDVLNGDMTINRQCLSDIVFNNEEERIALNHIVHPEVFKEDARLTEEIRSREGSAVIVKDIPLLFEESLTRLVDKVVVVYAGEENRVRRLTERGVTEREAERRMRAQFPLDEKVRSADFVVYNDGSIAEAREQVERLYAQLCQ